MPDAGAAFYPPAYTFTANATAASASSAWLGQPAPMLVVGPHPSIPGVRIDGSPIERPTDWLRRQVESVCELAR